MSEKSLVVVVTGLSGAGRSTALRALEDLGFFCIDSLPTALALEAVALCEKGRMTRIALGIDVRVRAFLGPIGQLLRDLANGGQRAVEVMFVDASDEALLRRFSETRRPHALSKVDGDGAFAILDGVRLERERLAPLRAAATFVIDTTALSVHDLRRTVLGHFGPSGLAAEGMRVRIVSFGFKYGIPVDADLVFDVRFLQNPYFVPELKNLPGTNPEVEAFVLAQPDAIEFLAKLSDLVGFVVPKYEREGKSYLTIAIGCTGGRHRSVVLAEKLAAIMSHEVRVVHRDVTKSETSRAALTSIPPDFAQHSEPPDQATHRELAAELSPLPSARTLPSIDKEKP